MTQKGKLFLASMAKDPKSIKDLDKFVGGLKNKSVAYCPTAANAEQGRGRWKESETLNIVKSLGLNIEIVELENFDNEDVVSKFRNKNIIWMAGGYSGYLAYWLRRFSMETVIPELLKKGAIYVGSSAGSMVCSKTNFASEMFPGEEEKGGAIIPGLGFIDFEIWPHYKEEHMAMLKEKWCYGKLCLLKNGEAITITDGKMEILGEERFLNQI
ncbi:Type 1 glutamine amidotransferase-like domain-containing protein [Candidatus Microgenomates bacterium]|nr:Type 1 glutamine amidotransferase-like domain-containing protein [Candidatus Microgenomates bacterium]